MLFAKPLLFGSYASHTYERKIYSEILVVFVAIPVALQWMHATWASCLIPLTMSGGSKSFMKSLITNPIYHSVYVRMRDTFFSFGLHQQSNSPPRLIRPCIALNVHPQHMRHLTLSTQHFGLADNNKPYFSHQRTMRWLVCMCGWRENCENCGWLESS